MPRTSRVATLAVAFALLLPLSANAQTTDERPARERLPVEYVRLYGNSCPPTMQGDLVVRGVGTNGQPQRLDQAFPGDFRIINEPVPGDWAPPVYRSTNKDQFERYLLIGPAQDDGLAHGVFVERFLGDGRGRLGRGRLRMWADQLPSDLADAKRGDLRPLGPARAVCGFGVIVGPLDDWTGTWLQAAGTLDPDEDAIATDQVRGGGDLLDPDNLLGTDEDPVIGLGGDDTLGGPPQLLGTDDGRHWVATRGGDRLLVRSVPPAERPPELAGLEARSPFLEVSLADGPLANPAAIAIVREAEDLPRNDEGDIPVPLVAFRSEDGEYSTPQQVAFFVSKGDAGARAASAGAAGAVDDAASLAVDWTAGAERWLSTDGTGPALTEQLPKGDWLAVVARIEEPGQAFLFAGGPFLQMDLMAEVVEGDATFSGRLIAPAAFDARLESVSVLGPAELGPTLDEPDEVAPPEWVELPTSGEPRQKGYRIGVECPVSGVTELLQVVEVRRIGAGSALFDQLGLPASGGRTRLALPLTADCP